MNQADDWRYVGASVPGVAHQASGIEGQDAWAAQLIRGPNTEPVLMLAVADGAGSATHSRQGAEWACHTLLTECATWLAQTAVADWNCAVAGSWLHRIQTVLGQQATAAGLPVREFACTLLGAMVATDHALFLQIGDGAIVMGVEKDYQTVFWPHSGQYANETYFVTDPNAADRLECIALAQPVTEIALLTDGLQSLALHYEHQRAHAPFFRTLFQQLRDYPETSDPATLATALARFLDSPAINQRTHDDKTLILATRRPAAHGGVSNTPTTVTTLATAPDTQPEQSAHDAADCSIPDPSAAESVPGDDAGDEAV